MWNDLESFIHVLHWCCLRFHDTEFSDDIDQLQTHIYSLYDIHSTKNGVSTGGKQKLRMLRAGNIPFEINGGSADSPNAAGLHRILTKLALLYKQHYQWLDAEGKLPKSSASSRPLAPLPMRPKRDLADGREPRSDISAGEESADEAEDAATKPRPVLRDHRRMIRILSNALTTSDWVDDVKGPDNFANFKNSPPAQRARASSQSLKRFSDDSQADDKPAKRVRRDGSSVPGSLSNTQQLCFISEDISYEAE